jgi:hypothetical protein
VSALLKQADVISWRQSEVIGMDLVSVLRQIHQSEIEVTLRSKWDLGWQLEIEQGQVARGMVASIDEAAAWFHEQVLAHYPDSLYSQAARGTLRQALPNDATARPLSAT